MPTPWSRKMRFDGTGCAGDVGDGDVRNRYDTPANIRGPVPHGESRNPRDGVMGGDRHAGASWTRRRGEDPRDSWGGGQRRRDAYDGLRCDRWGGQQQNTFDEARYGQVDGQRQWGYSVPEVCFGLRLSTEAGRWMSGLDGSVAEGCVALHEDTLRGLRVPSKFHFQFADGHRRIVQQWTQAEISGYSVPGPSSKNIAKKDDWSELTSTTMVDYYDFYLELATELSTF